MCRYISVVLPTFDRLLSTDAAVDSIFSSSPERIEIIVVDDCSVTPYVYRDEVNPSGISVRVIHLPRNVGPGMARRAGIASARGRYIAFLDSDDIYDKYWLDHVLGRLSLHGPSCPELISGIAVGSRSSEGALRYLLSYLSPSLQIIALRFIVIFFNPFSTPTLVLRKDLCQFMAGLRYCEDYYSSTVALFRARAVWLPSAVACHLGREPKSVGGLSAMKWRMFRGELSVRIATLRLSCVPIVYKALVPPGIFYQLFRTLLKVSVIR